MLAQFTRAVTLVKRTKGAPDDFGNDTFTEVGTVVRAAYAPGTSVEQLLNRDSVLDQPSIFVDPGADVSAVDAVYIDGRRYDVDGTPVAWEHPITGWHPGIEIKLRRATG